LEYLVIRFCYRL